MVDALGSKYDVDVLISRNLDFDGIISLVLYDEEIDMQKVALLVKGMRGRILVSRGPKPYITVKKSSGQSPLDTLEEAFNLLKSEEIKNDI